jgi:hypothetical protein
MEDDQKAGRRLPAPGRPAAEARTAPQPPPAQPAPRPVPAPRASTVAGSVEQNGTVAQVPTRSRPHPGVPMATQRAQPPRAAARAMAPPVEPDEELDFGGDIDPNMASSAGAPAQEPAEPAPSRVYSTRRALAEKLAQEDDATRHAREVKTSGLDSIKERRDTWRQMVKAKEAEGKSPYVTRILKGSFFPLIYVVISLQLLRRYRFEYGEFYNFEPTYLYARLVLGAITLLAMSARSMMRASRVRSPIALRDKGVVLGVLAFLAVSMYLAFFFGLAYAWQFSIGFFGAGLFVPLIGIGIEKMAKGTFWVKEPQTEDGTGTRWLEFVPVRAEA